MKLVKRDSKEVVQLQNTDKELSEIIQEVKEGTCKNENYSLTKRDLLVKRTTDKAGYGRQLLVIPEKLKSSIIKMCHEETSGHLSVKKTKDRLIRHFYWTGCYKETEDFVKNLRCLSARWERKRQKEGSTGFNTCHF
ncbi:hypothetical protein X975_27252, partial [Stegodyphus mimosarum]